MSELDSEFGLDSEWFRLEMILLVEYLGGGLG